MAQKVIGYKHCKNRHIIGQMRRDGRGAEVLELFRQAIDHGQDVWEPVDVIGVFSAGYGIRCSICNAVVDFHQSSRYAGPVATMGPQESE